VVKRIISIVIFISLHAMKSETPMQQVDVYMEQLVLSYRHRILTPNLRLKVTPEIRLLTKLFHIPQ
jgi:hypothetical protein